MLERVFTPPIKDELWVVSTFPWNRDEPHGKYGSQKLEIHTQKYKAVSEEEELELLRETYAGIPLKVRKRCSYWRTWEIFLEHNRCKCGMHGEKLQKPHIHNRDSENVNSMQFLPEERNNERH